MQELEYKNDKVKNTIQNASFIRVKLLSYDIPDDILQSNLDKGEMEAIALALETGLSLVIDEKTGRKLAKKRSSHYRLTWYFKSKSIKKLYILYRFVYILDEFKSVDFRVSKKLEKEFLDSLSKQI